MKRRIIYCLLFFFPLTLVSQDDYFSRYEKCYMRGLQASQQCMIGAPLPEFTVYTRHGEVMTTANLRGKVTVLHFWFTACPPCIAELDGLNDVVAQYAGNEDIAFLSFTLDREDVLQSDFFPNYEMPMPIVADAEEVIMIGDGFRLNWGFPTTMVVDREGRIFRIFSGGSSESEEASREIRDKLTELIEACLQP